MSDVLRQDKHFPFEGDADLGLRDLTLGGLVALAKSSEALLDLPPDQIDPESLVGKLALDPDASEEFRKAHRAKVDGVIQFIGEARALESRWKIRQDRARARMNAARNLADRYEQYLLKQLDFLDAEKFRGNEYEAVRRKASRPSVIVDQDADAATALKVPELVKHIPESWHWSDSALLESLKPFYKAIADNENCAHCNGKGEVIEAFEDEDILSNGVKEEVVECSKCFGSGKDIGDVQPPAAIEHARLRWSHWVELREYDNRDEITKPKIRKKKSK